MKVIDRIRHTINFPVVWFATEPVSKSGIITYHEAEFEVKGATEFITLVNDITGTDDEIKSGFSKSCKYKVNRAEREAVEIRILKNEEITDDIIDEFLDFFKTFWESKDTVWDDRDSVRRDLTDLRDVGALCIGIGLVNGQKAIYHTHIYDDNRARLLHSASLYRLENDEEGNTRNIIGMANRYLHYKEMLFFRDLGLKKYDWGGAGRGEDVINITEFKESFGGYTKSYYDFEVTKGLKARVFKALVHIMDDALNC